MHLTTLVDFQAECPLFPGVPFRPRNPGRTAARLTAMGGTLSGCDVRIKLLCLPRSDTCLHFLPILLPLKSDCRIQRQPQFLQIKNILASFFLPPRPECRGPAEDGPCRLIQSLGHTYFCYHVQSSMHVSFLDSC